MLRLIRTYGPFHPSMKDLQQLALAEVPRVLAPIASFICREKLYLAGETLEAERYIKDRYEIEKKRLIKYLHLGANSAYSLNSMNPR